METLHFHPSCLSRCFIFLSEVEHRFRPSKPIYTYIRRRARKMKSALAPEEHHVMITVSLAPSDILAGLSLLDTYRKESTAP